MEFNLSRQSVKIGNLRRTKIAALQSLSEDATHCKQIIQSGLLVTISSDCETFAYGEYIQQVIFTHEGLESFLYIEPCSENESNLTGNNYNIVYVQSNLVKVCSSFSERSKLYREIGNYMNDDVNTIVLSKSIKDNIRTEIKDILTLGKKNTGISFIKVSDDFIENSNRLLLQSFELTPIKNQLDILNAQEKKLYINVASILLVLMAMFFVLIKSSRDVIVVTKTVVNDHYVAYKEAHVGIPAVSAFVDYLAFVDKFTSLNGWLVKSVNYRNGVLDANLENAYDMSLHSLTAWNKKHNDIKLIIGPTIRAEYAGYSEREDIIEYNRSMKFNIDELSLGLFTMLTSISNSKIKINSTNDFGSYKVIYAEYMADDILNSELIKIIKSVKNIPMYIQLIQLTNNDIGNSLVIKFKLIGVTNNEK
ncbi:hypothetical protein [Aliivibrio fischeri]|uniref:hypothetical protein n=1 Tax=Aliivibrio fischeri TaxID=668 RepID=UPI0007C474E1|nr:hypothetical protein [Aliivibrio fischeri]